jgi:type IV secretory pathway VirJ component
MKTLVVGVDILRYYRELRERRRACYMVSPDFIELATSVEKKYNFEGYVPPVIMGYSSGATLVYGILAQARPGTFIGGISLGFCPNLELPKMLCQVNGLTSKVITEGKSYLLLPDARLGNPWIVIQGKKDKICDLITISDFVNKTADAELIVIPETGHDFSKMADFMPRWKGAYSKLLAAYHTTQMTQAPVTAFSRIPYTITHEKTTLSDGPIALFFSGDGGWYTFEQIIADKLAAEGIPTIGIDVKRYLWNRRTPEETAKDMADLLYYYGKEWNKTKFIVIGYSQGAEMVPFIANRLPDILKSNITSAVMLSPETSTDFEIHISNMLGLGSKQNKLNVVDEIVKMKNIPALCIFGENEKNPVPGLLKDSPVKIAFIPGDHHYRLNETLIVQTMKDQHAFEAPLR